MSTGPIVPGAFALLLFLQFSSLSPMDSVMCGCFGNMCTCIYCVLVMCVHVFTEFCIFCTVFFILLRVCTFILICFVCTTVRTTATEWQLNCSYYYYYY